MKKVKKVKAELATVKATTTALAVIPGVNDLTPEAVRAVTSEVNEGIGFLKLAQATSAATTSGQARIGEFTVGQNNRNLGTELHLTPLAYSYRAQLWGKGKRQGELISESRIQGSGKYKEIEKNRQGESGFEFLFYHEDEKIYSVFAFGKWKNRSIGQIIALALQKGASVVLKSTVVPGSKGKPPIANLVLEQDDSVYAFPDGGEEARTEYLKKVAEAQAEEREEAEEPAAPAGAKPR